jgi:hypothetical protein
MLFSRMTGGTLRLFLPNVNRRRSVDSKLDSHSHSPLASGMATPKEGSKAPNFTALTDEGKEVSLADFKDRIVVLYFYPKDDTPG